MGMNDIILPQLSISPKYFYFIPSLRLQFCSVYFIILGPFQTKLVIMINQNIEGMYFGDQNSDSYDSSSSEEKRFFCFCAKLFDTYSGLYQHLKSKHPNLFPTYKKMKLQKMLKKTKDSRGNYNYKLIKMAEENININPSADKIKTKTEIEQSRTAKNVNNNHQNEENKKKQKKAEQNDTKQKEQKNGPHNQNNKKNSTNYTPSQEGEKEVSDPFMNFPVQMPPYLPPYPHYIPPMFPHYPPMYPSFHLTIKGFLVRFLYQSPQKHRQQTKDYLYDWMIFMDKNTHLIKDPRTKGRVFLSYCDEFDPHYIGPLINEYIEKLDSSYKENITKYGEGQGQTKKLQIDCMRAFRDWLSDAGILRVEKEHKSETKVTENLQQDLREKEAYK